MLAVLRPQAYSDNVRICDRFKQLLDREGNREVVSCGGYGART
jgi:hypothetical protein